MRLVFEFEIASGLDASLATAYSFGMFSVVKTIKTKEFRVCNAH
jgi:hypothetical protein